MKKKTIITIVIVSILSAIIIATMIFSGIAIHRRISFFSKSVLEQNMVSDLPRISGKNMHKKYRKTITLDTSEEYFEKYVNEVYEYLVSCDFEYLGYRGKVLNTFFGGMPTYEFFEGTELSDYRYNVDNSDYIEYVFVWANELYDNSNKLASHFLEISRSTKSNRTYVELSWSFQSYQLVR